MTEAKRAVEQSTRPALVKLTNDLEAMEGELLAGFTNRRAVVEWVQRLTIRTLGELPDRWYFEMAAQFRPLGSDETAVLAALIEDETRQRDLADAPARELRERLAAITVRPAYHRAFRKLRRDAGEYVDSEKDQSNHDPSLQRYVAMRPAIDELEQHQQSALATCLDGLNSREAILDWGGDIELATHGEIPEWFTARCYKEHSTARLLTGERTADERARELFAAYHLCPYFNRGVRDLTGRATEQPEPDRPDREVSLA